MPFVRFSRDKRGYEYIYLFQEPAGKGGGSQPRVLYWYRTPPGVKVGREPFDAHVRHALENENPGVMFDWKKIMNAQPPPIPEAEPWRERRRSERSAKLTRAETRPEPPAGIVEVEPPQASVTPPDEPAEDVLPVGPVSPLASGRKRRRGGRRRNRGSRTRLQGQPSGAFPEDSGQADQSRASEVSSVADPGSENPDDETEIPGGPS